MNLWRWFWLCRRKGHDFAAWKQLETLPVPFLCCRRCGKMAPDEEQGEFFISWLSGRGGK